MGKNPDLLNIDQTPAVRGGRNGDLIPENGQTPLGENGWANEIEGNTGAMATTRTLRWFAKPLGVVDR
ncbi:hypothetical protein ACFL17_05075 [Pseudomonadota bacterium]